MRRADRLFQIVQYLRARRLTTAAQLAGWLQISERTVYRDIRDLSLSGVPVEGEAGVGYRLAKTFDLPPIMFTFDEVEALVAGARMIEAWGSATLAASSRSAIAKIALALPPGRRESVDNTKLFAPTFHIREDVGEHLDSVRLAISGHRKLGIHYKKPGELPTYRVVCPLGLYFWGEVWTVVAWCESRSDFRSFRLDRMERAETLPETFQDVEGQTLEDFLARVQAKRES